MDQQINTKFFHLQRIFLRAIYRPSVFWQKTKGKKLNFHLNDTNKRTSQYPVKINHDEFTQMNFYIDSLNYVAKWKIEIQCKINENVLDLKTFVVAII